MEVLEAIENAEAELARTREEAREYREHLAGLEQDERRLATELTGLRLFAARAGLTKAPESFSGDASVVPINSDIQPWTNERLDLDTLSRSDAVVAVMAASPSPMDRTMINEQLADAGRFESLDDVSLTLSGLKRSNRVIKLGRGLWQLSPEEQELATAEG